MTEKLELCLHNIPVKLNCCDKCKLDERFCNVSHKIEHCYQGIEKCFDKIHKLQEHHVRQIDENRKISRRVDEIQGSFGDDVIRIERNREKMEGRIDKLELLVNEIKEFYSSLCTQALRREPFKCPVCDGTGKQMNVLLSMPPQYPDCKSCDGKGIVWG